jgi:hypothetical protein
MSKKASKITNRWVEAPKPTHLMLDVPALFGVNLSPDENVEWVWTHTDKGSYISGYNIIKKQN